MVREDEFTEIIGIIKNI